MVGKYPKSIPSKAYCDKLPKYVKQIKEQFPFKTINFPVKVTIDVYEQNESWFTACKEGTLYSLKKKIKGTDVDNKISSVFDILVEAKVLLDDALILELTARKHIGQKLPCQKDWGAQVFIERVHGFH
jgi:Holliday junction resolvase RusA-like endonuclease